MASGTNYQNMWWIWICWSSLRGSLTNSRVKTVFPFMEGNKLVVSSMMSNGLSCSSGALYDCLRGSVSPNWPVLFLFFFSWPGNCMVKRWVNDVYSYMLFPWGKINRSQMVFVHLHFAYYVLPTCLATFSRNHLFLNATLGMRVDTSGPIASRGDRQITRWEN